MAKLVSNGHAVRGIDFRMGDRIDNVVSLKCAPVDSTTAPTSVSVGVGWSQGWPVTESCPKAAIDGFFSRSPDQVGGLALHCVQ
jgi:hypothetical protein